MKRDTDGPARCINNLCLYRTDGGGCNAPVPCWEGGRYFLYEAHKTTGETVNLHGRDVHTMLDCIDFIAGMGMDFLRGSAVKCIVRAGMHDGKRTDDLEKAIFYLNREIERRKEGQHGKENMGVPVHDASAGAGSGAEGRTDGCNG